MIKRILMVCGIAAAGAFAWPATADAQQPPPLSQLVPKADATVAVDSPYGLALVDQLAKSIAASAGKTCVQSRKLDAAAFQKGAQNLLLHYVPTVQGILDRMLDSPEFAQQLAATVPSAGIDQLRTILQDEVVKERIGLLLHDHIAILLDVLTEKIDQVSILERLLRVRVSTTNSGEQTLLKIVEQRISETEYAMDLFDKANPSPHTAAFNEIWLAWPLVLAKTSGSGPWGNMRPADYVPGLKDELAKLCVGQP